MFEREFPLFLFCSHSDRPRIRNKNQQFLFVFEIMPSSSLIPIGQSRLNDKTIKCVCVGDGCVGKTSMLISYTSNTFPQSYVPTVFDNYLITVIINGEPFQLALFDTAGQIGEKIFAQLRNFSSSFFLLISGFETMRSLSYANTDVFLVCFSVVSPSSFKNLGSMWINEIRSHCPDTAIVLVGTKIDLRSNKNELELLAKSKEKPIYREQAEKFVKDLGLSAYVECSALTQENLKETFDTAIIAALRPTSSKRLNYFCCSN